MKQRQKLHHTLKFVVLMLSLSFGLTSCEEIMGEISPNKPEEEQGKYVIYENLGSFKWTYLIADDEDNLLLVSDDDGKFSSAYGIFSNDTIFVLSDLEEGTLAININKKHLEIVCEDDSVVVYSKNNREKYTLREALTRAYTSVSNDDMLNVLFGSVVNKAVEKVAPSLITKPVEMIKHLYLSETAKVNYLLNGDNKLITSDKLDDLLTSAEKTKSNYISTVYYYIGVETGGVTVRGLTAELMMEGYLHIDANNSVYEYECGICYAESPKPTIRDNVSYIGGWINKRSYDVELPTSFYFSNLGLGKKYYYRAYFKDILTGKVEYAAEIKEFTTQELCSDVNHIHAVDLGLSVKWACCNVGAESPEEYGGYYAWGETEEKAIEDYTSLNYKYYLGDLDGDGSFMDSNEYVNIGTDISGTQYDVAHVKWGNGWRMPTSSEFQELIDSCSWKELTINGNVGYHVVGPNGNSIFLPVAGAIYVGGYIEVGYHGMYWSSTYCPDDEPLASYLEFSIYGDPGVGVIGRLGGCTVRPVQD
ncbi:MAG: hypothetical protein IKY64_07350 [Bacteroidaceae bacterium]|nr:hypothetical protein [Bacteroidaceae bacterium]